ncbi:MAG: hypothetical protein ACI39T_03105 [Candidatus Cryptobacteroides sp.]
MGRFDTSLTREVPPETLVGRMSVAEGRFKTGLPRDHASETTVGKGAVAETGRSTGKRPISGRPDTLGFH